jgi:transposase-like protein
MGSTWVLYKWRQHQVCLGKLCPSCHSTFIKTLGKVPGDRSVHTSYKCKVCLKEWDGY